MRILVVGDSHGDSESILKAAVLAEKFDIVLHTGDFFMDLESGMDLMGRYGIDMSFESHGVTGNCDGYKYGDAYENMYLEKLIDVGNVKILLCHGHKYGVKKSLNNLFYRAEELGVQVVVFGHTHRATLVELEGLYLFNPGSTSKPDGQPFKTFGIIEIDEESEKISFSHKKIE